METLNEPLRRRFHQELLDHVKTHFREETAARSDYALLAHIRQALQRAEQYGLRAEKDLYLYINISMIHGPDFDRKKETAWTRTFLCDEDVSSPSQRMHRLYEAVISQLEIDERFEREHPKAKSSLRRISDSHE